MVAPIKRKGGASMAIKVMNKTKIIIALTLVALAGCKPSEANQIDEKEILSVADQSADSLNSLLTNLCLGISDIAACRSVYKAADEKIAILEKHKSPAINLRIDTFSMLAHVSRAAEMRLEKEKKTDALEPISIMYKNGKCQGFDRYGNVVSLQSNGVLYVPAGSTIEGACLKDN